MSEFYCFTIILGVCVLEIYAFYNKPQLGSPCVVEGQLGNCTFLRDCEEEQIQVKVSGSPRQHCGYKGKKELVCCELKTIANVPMKSKKFGEIGSCKYDGTLPLRCYPPEGCSRKAPPTNPPSTSNIIKKSSKCEVEGNPGICKALADCRAKYHRNQCDDGLVCCATRQTYDGFFGVRNESGHIDCTFDGTLPVQCYLSEQVHAAPLQDAGCPPPPPLEETDVLIKRKCLEYSQYGSPCKRRDLGQFVRQEVCFQSKMEKRIVGGAPAQLFEFPHMVVLGYRKMNAEIWSNGGALISERAVLSAAHAVDTVEYGKVKQVCMGLHDRRRACRSELKYRVRDIISHEDYSPMTTYHDIAVLQLDRSVIMNEYVRPACLPGAGSATGEVRRNLVVSGWGRTSQGGKDSNELRKTRINEFETTLCEKKQQGNRRFPQGWLANLQLCAGSMQHTNDSCGGDSGGPLQTYADDGIPCSYVLIGVVSAGLGCGIPGSPGVYTRVAGYNEWIVSKVWPKG